MSEQLYVADVCGSSRYATYELRRHLSAMHHLPPGLSYLVPAEELSAFHDAAHGHRGRVRGWLFVRRQLRRRRRARRSCWCGQRGRYHWHG